MYKCVHVCIYMCIYIYTYIYMYIYIYTYICNMYTYQRTHDFHIMRIAFINALGNDVEIEPIAFFQLGCPPSGVTCGYQAVRIPPVHAQYVTCVLQ